MILRVLLLGTNVLCVSMSTLTHCVRTSEAAASASGVDLGPPRGPQLKSDDAPPPPDIGFVPEFSFQARVGLARIVVFASPPIHFIPCRSTNIFGTSRDNSTSE